MSFKSKQRAKHGHLFGDDPLNAGTSSSTPDPPRPARTSQPSSPLDPLSRSSSPSNNSNSSNGGSIFSGIDVSKFGNKRTALRSSTSLRSTTASLNKLVNDGDDDDDFLFGGGGRKTSTSSSLRKPATSNNSLPTSSPRAQHSTIMVPTPISPSTTPTATMSTTSRPTQVVTTSPSPSPPPRVNSSSSINSLSSAQSQPKRQPPPPPPARRPTSISKSAISPLVSSSASSLSSLSSSTSSASPAASTQPNAPPPPPPRIHKIHQQQDLLRQLESSVEEHEDTKDSSNEVDNEEDRSVRQQKEAMMEDEATRAFAMETTSSVLSASTSSSMLMNYDDPELYASFTQFQSLSLSGSASTPTNRTTTSVELPMSPNMITPTVLTSAAMSNAGSSNSNNNSSISNSSNPWSNGPMTATFLTPTMSTPFPTVNSSASSSPVRKQQDIDKRLKEIEPAKRVAFADLIANWHGEQLDNGHIINGENPAQMNDNDDKDDQFLSNIACEQRDVGFAGINASEYSRAHRHHVMDADGDDGEYQRSRSGLTSFGWHQDSILDDNPWS